MKRAHMVVAVLALSGLPARASAQTFDYLNVSIKGYRVTPDGGEQSSVAASTGAVTIGHTRTAGFSLMPGRCGMHVASWIEPDAVSSWLAQVTPIRVVDDAVTFRLKWGRMRVENVDVTPPNAETELTLRPGQSWPIDVMPVPAALKQPSAKCSLQAVSLRVTVEHRPSLQDDMRLVATDLWLVERLQNGTERSQPISLKSQVNQNVPFFFDRVTEGETSLDMFGGVEVAARNGALIVKLETRSRVIQKGATSDTLSDVVQVNGSAINMMRMRKVASTLTIKPGEVVDVQLPRLSENESGAFADRTFFIRVKARQIR